MTAPAKAQTAAEKERIKSRGKTYAEKTVNKTYAKSNIKDCSGDFPKFSKQELKLGKVLGKGGFGTVYEVRGFEAGKAVPKKKGVSSRNLVADQDDEVQMGEMESRKFISDHCLRNNNDARYAVKFLSPNVVDDPASFIQGMIDMSVETRVLSDTAHPNIVRLRALAQVSPYDENYFIVMDRLYDTLEGRIEKWLKLFNKCSGIGGKVFDRKGEKKKELLEEKMVAAFDLSDALGYLHGRKIIYRDIKPENIGFDIRGDIKLFDFGLAKELSDDKQIEDGLYKLTEMTGSPRYMAPEVANGQNYNEKCDVYSFAILLWQMNAMKVPFALYTMKSLKSRVWSGENKRPEVDPAWPVPIKNLLRRAWSQDITERPSFPQVTTILRNECVRIRDGCEDGLEHSRRRSTFVFRGARGQLTSTKTSVSATVQLLQSMGEADEEDD